MLDHMNDTYLEIVKSGGSHEDYIMDLFNDLLLSKNNIFNDYIQRSKDEWEVGKDFDPDEIIATAIEKYNTMIRQKIWKTQDSLTSKIVALTTQVKALEDRIKKGSKDTSSSGNDSNKPLQFLVVAEWRKTKSFGPSTNKDDKQWHWCSIKHNNGKGMYVTHKEEDHGKFLNRNTSDSSTSGSSSKKSTGKSTNKSMTLSDNLKAAMISKFKCSGDEAAKSERASDFLC